MALALCVKHLPDAILLDWNMPNMNGLEFLHELRQVPGGDRPIVVFCTTENDIEHIQEAITAGANEYIMKPFDSEILQANFPKSGCSDRWCEYGFRTENVSPRTSVLQRIHSAS